MLTSRRISLALAATVIAALVPLASAISSASATGNPATVTVRIQGLGGETLLQQTQVTTNTTPIAIEGGGTCEGTSAGGAIYDATGGNWKVKNQSVGIELQGLEGLDLPEFSSKEPSGIYWAFWLEGKYDEEGICSQSIASGQHIVMFPQCYAVGPLCESATAPNNFLTAVPAGATANVGQQVPVTLGAVNTETFLPENSLPGGDLLTDGAQTFAPAADGIANVSFSAPGLYMLQAHAPNSVASDPFTICVHNGNDGTCGTTPIFYACAAPAASVPACYTCATASVAVPACVGPVVITPPPGTDIVTIKGVENGHRYSRRKGPRILQGVVQVPASGTLKQVRISLQRREGKRCSVFSGTKEAFVRARCDTTRFFSAGDSESFSYLLPSSLPPGRYVYEIEALDDSGNLTKLVPGVSHVVFYVK
jgi:hypothetical protein